MTETDELLSQRIAEVLRNAPGPLGPKAIHEEIGGSYDSIRSTLGTMRDRDEVERVGHGRYTVAALPVNGPSEPRSPYDISAKAEPAGRFAHLVQAGAVYAYALTTPDGRVRAAVKITMLLDPDTEEETLSLTRETS